MTTFLGFTTGLFLGISLMLLVAGAAVAAMQAEVLDDHKEHLRKSDSLLLKLDNRLFMKDLGIESEVE